VAHTRDTHTQTFDTNSLLKDKNGMLLSGLNWHFEVG